MMRDFLQLMNKGTLPLQHVPHVFDCVPEKREAFLSLWHRYDRDDGRTGDPIRVLQLVNLVETANMLEEGHYIELGVHRGHTLRIIHRVMDPQKQLYGLDTFTGFDPRDVTVERTRYPDNGTKYGFHPTSVEGVRRYLEDGADAYNVKIVKGWFPESFRGLEEMRWRFVHIDFDLYEPVRQGMALLWPRIVPGGIVVVHDYGCLGFPGVKMAVDEFSKGAGVFPIQLSDRWGSVVFRKAREAN
jgi:hypothetical protein